MPDWLQMLLTAITAVGASSGFWVYIQNRDKTSRANNRLMMGLAYDRIVTLGLAHIRRGWITEDEYKEFRHYFYEPYKALGGNGVAERIAIEVSNLPLRQRSVFYTEIIQPAKKMGSENEQRSEAFVE